MSDTTPIGISITIPASVKFDAEANVWVAWCSHLGPEIRSQGTSAVEASRALRESVSMYLRHRAPKVTP